MMHIRSWISPSLILTFFLISSTAVARLNLPEDETPGSVKSLFAPPVHIPIYLSSNFMELRTDHFHSGIDIKTRGVSGVKIFAIAEGYVSRIKISTSGFGQAVYITHPNGYTSVYAHLSRMSKKITSRVRDAQYQNRSYTVDLFFRPGQIPVKRNELIGYSGNTGNSFGPHLHFEIRDTQTEHPVNPLQFKFPVKDTIAPVFKSLTLYPHSQETTIGNYPGEKRFKLVRKNGRYVPNGNNVITASGPVSFGIEVQDYLNGSRNRCGIYDMRVTIDGREFFHIVMDEFSYSTSRYINAIMDYPEKINNGRNIIRTYITPNNRLSIYRKKEEHGILSFHDFLEHKIEIIASDIYGNTSRLDFILRKTTPPVTLHAETMDSKCRLMLWNRENRVVLDQCQVILPANSLYDTLCFKLHESPPVPNSLAPVYSIHDASVPLQRAFILSIEADSLNTPAPDKLLLASVDNQGNLSAAGGAWDGEKVTGTLRRFGQYTVAADTVPPQIHPLFNESDTVFTRKSRIAFKISDDFSGIQSYNGTIDGKWVLFEYEPKKDLLWYTFDPERLAQKRSHNLVLEVTDQKDNKNEYRYSFYW